MRPSSKLILLAFGLSAIAAFLSLPPHDFLGKSYFVASGVCHRLPQHSLFFGGKQSPLCARCTGNYLGLLVVSLFLALRRRLNSSLFPPPGLLVVLAAFVALWGIDGVNSFVEFWRGEPLLYHPSQELRLITGVLNGLTWGFLFVPFFNSVVLKNPAPRRSLENFAELVLNLLVGIGLAALVRTQWPFLLYPLALLSLVGPLILLGAINTILLKLAFNFYPEGIEKGGEIIPLFLAGIGVGLLEISALNLLRATIGL